MKVNGFTLIELIVVIVILSVLSVTAAPKVLGFQSDARKATLKSIAAAIRSGSDIVHSKAVIDGVDGKQYVFLDDIYITNGYPTAHIENMKRAFSINNPDVYITNRGSDADGREAFISFTKEQAWYGKCYVSYKDAVSAATPVTTVVSDGC
ncbi:type II secretion system protein [Vibrio sp. SCSIO 43137]|uniref:type II secretion system protein n=1 Tax=Vibrio sp. SCSIO 43137 TaxID=3021011 RepID=UPI002307803C|nr:type II secretion system protein [Vibrio sp. SCSIO 43137]WCE30781.1 type II secretion system protein [Vibrio sp. SCSIO 43137]